MNPCRTPALALAALLGCTTLSGCLEVVDRLETNGAGQVRFTTVVRMDPIVLDTLEAAGTDRPEDTRTLCTNLYRNVLHEGTSNGTGLTLEDDVRHAFAAIGIHLADAGTTPASQIQCTWKSRWFAPLEVDETTRAALWTEPEVRGQELFVSPRKPADFDELRDTVMAEARDQAFDPRHCLEPQADPSCDERLVALAQAADTGDAKAREQLEAMARVATYAVQASIEFVLDAIKQIDYRIELAGVRALEGFRDEDGQAVWEGTVGDLLASEQRYAIALQ